jgi:hypothetical protein
MKNLNKLFYITLVVGASACTNMGYKESENSKKAKSFTTIAEAAKMAKADMLAAMDQKVNFGVDKEVLRAAEPGMEISMMSLDPAMLLNADTGAQLLRLAKSEGNLTIPFVHQGAVAAVATLSSSGNEFKITGLGDKFLSTELKTVYEMNQKMQGNLSIVQVDNLNATVYIIDSPKGDSMNHPQGGYVLSSYNGHNLRVPLNEREFISTLSKDARMFMEKYGDKLKKDNLVR